MDEQIPPVRRVVCHTPGCFNENKPIVFPCLMDVFCQPCGNRITDIITL